MYLQEEESPPWRTEEVGLHDGNLLARDVPHQRLLVRDDLGLFMDRPIYFRCRKTGYIAKRAAPRADAKCPQLVARFQRHAYDVALTTPTSVTLWASHRDRLRTAVRVVGAPVSVPPCPCLRRHPAPESRPGTRGLCRPRR